MPVRRHRNIFETEFSEPKPNVDNLLLGAKRIEKGMIQEPMAEHGCDGPSPFSIFLPLSSPTHPPRPYPSESSCQGGELGTTQRLRQLLAQDLIKDPPGSPPPHTKAPKRGGRVLHHGRLFCRYLAAHRRRVRYITSCSISRTAMPPSGSRQPSRSPAAGEGGAGRSPSFS